MTTAIRAWFVLALSALPCVFAAKRARPLADLLTEAATDAFDLWSSCVAWQREAVHLAQAIERRDEYAFKNAPYNFSIAVKALYRHLLGGLGMAEM